MEFGAAEQFTTAMNAIKPLTQELNVYGIYKKGETIM
jgi:hypothetical protein